jgi:hypothetical protein
VVEADKCAISVGFGTSGLTAPAGARVCVFSLDFVGSSPYPFTDTGQAVPGLQGTITIGSRSLPPTWDALTDSNSVDYAIAVPDGPSATLSLTAAGFLPVLLAHRGSTGRRPAGQP